MTEFSPGLAGVVAFETEIAEPDKEGGELRYRGVNIEERGSAFAPPPSGAPELAGLDPERTVELGEVLAGTRPGRTNAEQLTLYKSVGVAVQDLAAAGLVLAASEARA